MLQALGPRLQHLAIGYRTNTPVIYIPERLHQPQDSLAPTVLRHCPLLEQLTLQQDPWPGDIAEVSDQQLPHARL